MDTPKPNQNRPGARSSDSLQLSAEALAAVGQNLHARSDVQKLLTNLGEQNASNVLEVVLSSALFLHASDAHIDAAQGGARIRMRIDGILYDVATLDEHLYGLLLSRIKLLSGLKINVQSIPQEGRFSFEYEDRAIEIRSSTLPSDFGEDIALRILDPRFLLSLAQLGMRGDIQATVENQLQKPQGLTLVTGPTGSGKTTTLYAALQFLKNPQIKIVTIEDPIEYRLAGISQTQVDAQDGYTFAEGLKAILRQDPDIVMLSELREADSSEAALQASLAGRRVLSTLHTNDAAGAVPRLLDMRIDAEALASGLGMVIAQRLIRKLCESCKTPYQPTPQEQALLAALPQSLAQYGGADAHIATAAGEQTACQSCGGDGYQGRLGVFEAFTVTDELRKRIMERASEDELRSFLIEKGMTTMQEDALLKVLQGVTSFDELRRVFGELQAKAAPRPPATPEGPEG